MNTTSNHPEDDSAEVENIISRAESLHSHLPTRSNPEDLARKLATDKTRELVMEAGWLSEHLENPLPHR